MGIVIAAIKHAKVFKKPFDAAELVYQIISLPPAPVVSLRLIEALKIAGILSIRISHEEYTVSRFANGGVKKRSLNTAKETPPLKT